MIKYADYSKSYKVRSTGWIQDAADFNNLHRFVSLFSKNSIYYDNLIDKIKRLVPLELQDTFLDLLSNPTISLSYKDIVGTAPNESRKTNTICNAIGQAALKGQKREFQGDWPTDNFLRWAEALQFVHYSPYSDAFEITETGEKYAECTNFEEQKDILINQLLMYPPATQILNLLNQQPQSKFTLGNKLGFIGEKGFTYITEELFIEKYFSESDYEYKKKIKSDFEGSSDKYARQICSWFKKLGLVKYHTFKYKKFNEILSLRGYEITIEGKNFLRRSSNSKKFIPFGMLSMETRNKEKHCKRRALILQCILRKRKTLNDIYTYLFDQQIETSELEIIDDLSSLINIGLNITCQEGYYFLNEKIIGLLIPHRISVDIENDIEKLKKELRKNTAHLDHDLLNLVEYSYSKKSAKFFEVYVAKVYKQINKNTHLLGGPSKPDVVTSFDDFSIIIDAKAYKNGFPMPITERDKMVRYIEEYKRETGNWVNELKDEKSYKEKVVFQFVSSSFQNVESKLENIYDRTSIKGSVITAVNLLYLADKILGEMNTNSYYELFTQNNEIVN